LKVENYKKKLTTSQDVVDAINNQQRFSNIERKKAGLMPIDTIPLVHNYTNEEYVSVLVVDNLRCFYNFFTDENFELNSLIISDLSNPIKIRYRTNQNLKQKLKKINTLNEVKAETDEINIAHIQDKHSKMKKMIESNSCNFKETSTLNK